MDSDRTPLSPEAMEQQVPMEGYPASGHEGPNVRALSSGHEGPDDEGLTSGHEAPNLSAQTLGASGGGSEPQKNIDLEAPNRPLASGLDTQVVAVGNQKGGVCKSTLAVNLAAELGALGRRCLIIDLDANCGATRSLGVPTTWMGTFEALLGTEHADQLVLGNDPEEDIHMPPGVDLLPANRKLEGLDRVFREMRENKFRDPTDALEAPLRQLQGMYDYIFLDTAPNAQSPTIAAYKSARWFVLSMTPDKLAYEALVDALTDILAVRDSGNPDLALLGVVLSQIDRRTTLADRYISRIRREFGQAGQQGAFENTISRSVVVSKANEAGKVLRMFDPKHKVTGQYADLAVEFEERLRRVLAEGSGGGEEQERVVELRPSPQGEVPPDPEASGEGSLQSEPLTTGEEEQASNA